MTKWLVIAFALFTLGHAADFLLQADQHGWIERDDGSYWRLARGEKWGAWDFIPHDAWHAAQSTRNLFVWLAAVCAAVGMRQRRVWYAFAAAAVLYAAGRALGFSLLMYLVRGALA